MSNKSIAVSAALIWEGIRPLLTGENRREAAQVLFVELKLNNVSGSQTVAKLLWADAGELFNRPYKDACDSCGEQAVWQGFDNEYDGSSRLTCNNCVVEIEEPVLIQP